MSQTTYTADDLKNLPLRAIVAFAVRCARRVEPMALAPGGHAEKAAWDSAVAEALRVAEDFARGRPCPTLESAVGAVEAWQGEAQGDIIREDALAAVVRAVHAAATASHAIAESEEPAEKSLVSGGPPVQPLAHLARLSAELAAMEALTAAMDADKAMRSTDDLSKWADDDYRKLLAAGLGRYPEAGQPVDPSPDGPLGPLRS